MRMNISTCNYNTTTWAAQAKQSKERLFIPLQTASRYLTENAPHAGMLKQTVLQ